MLHASPLHRGVDTGVSGTRGQLQSWPGLRAQKPSCSQARQAGRQAGSALDVVACWNEGTEHSLNYR